MIHPQQLTLTDGTTAPQERTSSQWPTILRVKPGEPEASLLYLKVAGTQGIRGLAMPMGQPPDQAFAALVERWILDGAKRCER